MKHSKAAIAALISLPLFLSATARKEVAEKLKESVKALKSAKMEKVVSRRSMYKERFGYFYSSSSAAAKLNQSRQALNKAVQVGRVLRVKTRDGEYVYPAFQFAGSKVVPEISRLVSILKDGGMDDWSVLYWLTNPLPMFDGETPASMAMNNDGRFEQVVELAQADAVRWVAAG